MKLKIDYSLSTFQSDLLAALTVAAISLPQGMAYALLAGVDPRYGLYSAIVVTFMASVFGSSSHLINGPTSAISLVIFGALSVFDPSQGVEAAEAMLLLGAMVGSIQILISVLRLGDLTRYISEAVILGFMASAALLLGLGQIGNVLGVKLKGSGNLFYSLWLTLTSGVPINSRAAAAGAVSLVLAVALRRLVRRYKLPQFDMLVVLVVVGLAAYLLRWTIPNVFGRTAIAVAGSVPASLPTFHVPRIQPEWPLEFLSDAFAIAFLGLLEAVSIAKAIANQTRQPLDYNQQILAEGVANLTGSLFQCLPGSGSLSRSAINFQAGAKTRFSGILTAGVVAVAVILFAPLARYVPTPVLAALLILTSGRIIDFKRLWYTLRASRLDALVVAVTALCGLSIGLDQAILIGVALSILLFVPRAAKLKVKELLVDAEDVVREKLPSDPPNVGFLIYDLEGELFFGAAPEIDRAFLQIRLQAKAEHVENVIIRLKRVRHPDVVSLEHLEHFLRHVAEFGIDVRLAGVQPDLAAAFRRLDFYEWFPESRIYEQREDEHSATLAAVRDVRETLPQREGDGQSKLRYLVR